MEEPNILIYHKHINVGSQITLNVDIKKNYRKYKKSVLYNYLQYSYSISRISSIKLYIPRNDMFMQRIANVN